MRAGRRGTGRRRGGWRIGGWLLAGLLLGSLACDGGEEEAPLRFWQAMGGPLGRSLDGLVAEWNAAHPEAALENACMGQYAALAQKLMAAVAAGGPPDVAQCYPAWTATLAANGSLTPCERFLAGPDGLSPESLADVHDVFLDEAREDGVLWSFPFNKSVRVLFLNRDRFREAGLDPDRPPRTWAEYRETARRLTRDEDGDGVPERVGLACQITVDMFENLLAQAGGRLLAEGGATAAFAGPEGLAALEFMTDLLLRDGSAVLTRDYEFQNEFLGGRAAMIEASSVTLAFLEGKVTFDLGIAPLPAGAHDTQLVTGTDVVIFRTDAAREAAAWRFVAWFTATPQTARWAAETGYLPVRRSALEHPHLRERLARQPGLAAAWAQVERAQPQPRAPGWYAGRRILQREAVEPVLRGRLSPAAGLANAERAVNAALADARAEER